MKLFYYSILFFISTQIFYSQSYKGIYVDKFNVILGNKIKEDSLFNYLKSNKFNAISLYDLHKLNFSSSSVKSNLKSFISRAKTLYGIQNVGAVAEIASFFTTYIVPYNKASKTEEQFNVFNLEFEFWVPSSVDSSGYYCTTYLSKKGFSCDESGAFKFYMQELKTIDAFCSANGWISEVYLGWFDQAQANEIKLVADRILLSNYNANPNLCFDYSLARLEYLGNNTNKSTVIALFSSEMDFLNAWLAKNNNDLDGAYSIFTTKYTANKGAWKSNVNLIGQHWFMYSTMNYQLGVLDVPEVQKNAPIIYPNPFQDEVFITSLEKQIEVYSINLQLVDTFYHNPALGANFSINLKHLPNGVYIIKMGEKSQRVIKF